MNIYKLKLNKMRNSGNKDSRENFQIIKKDQNNEAFENSSLNGTSLNQGLENSIEDSYQNVNFERDTNTFNAENIQSEANYQNEKQKFDKDIADNGLHDGNAGKE